MYLRVGKRLFDIVVSAIGLAGLSPVFAITALAIVLDDGWPVFHRQLRVGLHEANFTLYKFRSMPLGCDIVPSSVLTQPSLTRVGRLIRRYNVDELPQLVNILMGDMSVVGPRPALPVQEELCRRRREAQAFTLKPGLTGLAQVRAYDNMPDEEKVSHDSEYASSASFLTDLRIIFRTVIYLLKRPPTY